MTYMMYSASEVSVRIDQLLADWDASSRDNHPLPPSFTIIMAPFASVHTQ
jgi:hypothetical protein